MIQYQLTKTQKEALGYVAKGLVTYVVAPAPFRRMNTYDYVCIKRNFTNKTFEILKKQGLIKHEKMIDCIGGYTDRILLTDTGKVVLCVK